MPKSVSKTYNQQNTWLCHKRFLKIHLFPENTWNHTLPPSASIILSRVFKFRRDDCYWSLHMPHYPTHSYWSGFASPALTETSLSSTLYLGSVTTVGERVTSSPLKPTSSVRSKLCLLCGCICVSRSHDLIWLQAVLLIESIQDGQLLLHSWQVDV